MWEYNQLCKLNRIMLIVKKSLALQTGTVSREILRREEVRESVRRERKLCLWANLASDFFYRQLHLHNAEKYAVPPSPPPIHPLVEFIRLLELTWKKENGKRPTCAFSVPIHGHTCSRENVSHKATQECKETTKGSDGPHMTAPFLVLYIHPYLPELFPFVTFI